MPGQQGKKRAMAPKQQLWTDYRRARELSKRVHAANDSKRKVVEQEAKRLKKSVSSVLNLVRIGAPETGLSTNEVRDIGRMSTKYGRNVPVDLLLRLVSLPEPNKRLKFAEQALRGGWSIRQADAELVRRYGRRRRGGRRPKTLTSVEAFLTDIEAKTFSWTRLGHFLDLPGNLDVSDLPRGVQKPLLNLIAAAERLHEAVEPHLGNHPGARSGRIGTKSKASATRKSG